MRAHAEVLDGLTAVPLPSQQDGVGTGRRTESELIKSDSLTTRLENALLGGTGEAKGGNGQLGDFQEANIVGNSSNDYDDLGVTFGGIRGLLDNAGERDGRAIDLGEEESVEDGLYCVMLRIL